jgi:Tol biopolymer transport system component
MRQKSMALLLLAGTIALSGCGSTAAPAAAPSLENGASLSSPAKAQPAKSEVQAPAAKPAETTNNAAPAPAPAAGANVSGGSAIGAPQTEVGGAAPAGGNIGLSGGMGWGGNDFIVFASDRQPGEYNNDIYVFDPVIDTVLAIVGVNTYANEFNPRISDNGKWLVFQRTQDNGYGYDQQDILMYNMGLKLVNTLPMLNTEEFDEYMPDVTDDGTKIVYVTEVEPYKPELRLYDVVTGDNWAIPGANRNFRDISWPTISANGKRIAYGASIYPGDGVATDYTYQETGGPAVTGNPLYFGESNIYVYDVLTGTQLTPPFINTAFDEYNPDLCLDGSRVLFVSNRLGTEDIFEVNLDTGWTDNLSFLNTDELDEQHPRYLGGSVDRLVFQIKPYGVSTYPVALRAYNRASATLDTLPVANQIFANSALRAPQPETLP